MQDDMSYSENMIGKNQILIARETNPVSSILENARLDIVQFGFSSDFDFTTKNRVFPSFYGLSYSKYGQSILRINGKDYVIRDGDAVLIPPNTKHDHLIDQAQPASYYMWWNFTYTLYDMIDIMSMLDLPIHFHVENNQIFERAFEDFFVNMNEPAHLSDYMLRKAKIYELMSILFSIMLPNRFEFTFGQTPNVFVAILAEIIRCPEHHNLLTMLSEKFYLHPTYISNHFKKLYHVTPTQFQRKVRLQKASDMLLGGAQKSISQITEELGYEQLSDFTRFFKANYGMSPLQYRNQASK